MKEYNFGHNGPVYAIYDEKFETIYYARGDKKYMRIRTDASLRWEQVSERLISNNLFWMTVACIERRRRHA